MIKVMSMEFIKKCPRCGTDQFYSCKSALTLAIKKNTLCNSCRASFKKITPPNGVWKRICRKCGNEMIYSCRTSFNTSKRKNSVCRKCAILESSKRSDRSVFKTEEYRKRQSEMMLKARRTDSYGEEFKEKLRKHKINSFRKNGKTANFNPVACKFIDILNGKFGWKLRHALNGGEIELCGYFPDGYDESHNIIFEYDEPKHDSNYHKNRDLKRQMVLLDKIKPSMFLRYNEARNKLIDIISGKELL